MYAVTRTPIAAAVQDASLGGWTWGKSAPQPAPAGDEKAAEQPGR
jgi:hypothetical protein